LLSFLTLSFTASNSVAQLAGGHIHLESVICLVTLHLQLHVAQELALAAVQALPIQEDGPVRPLGGLRQLVMLLGIALHGAALAASVGQAELVVIVRVELELDAGQDAIQAAVGLD